MTFNDILRIVIGRGDSNAKFVAVYSLHYLKDPTATRFDDRWGSVLTRCNGIDTIKDFAKFVAKHNIGSKTVFTKDLGKLEYYQIVANAVINSNLRVETSVAILDA